MTSPHFSGSAVAQALYTWSKASIDGSKGMGFAAISPSLEGSIDWLSKLQLPEFQLLPPGIDDSLNHYESRVGFSEVGRIRKEGIGIIYCKTADGAMDSFSRPQPVVHAFFGDAETLGLRCLISVHSDRWIRRVEGSVGGADRLLDADVSLICADPMEAIRHSCPEDHDGARQLLRMVAESDIERIGTIEIAFGHEALRQVFLAFPMDIANDFCLTPYVTVDGTRRELGLRVPDIKSSGNTVPSVNSDVGGCDFQRSITQAGTRFLFVTDSSLRRYAEAALELTATRRQRSTVPSPAPKSADSQAYTDASMSPGELEVLLEAVNAVRRDSHERPLTPRESLALAERLSELQFNMMGLLEVSRPLIVTVFKNVAKGDVVLRWSRRFASVPVDKFADLWNQTGVAFFLGVVLLRNWNDVSVSWHIDAKQGISPVATAEVLRSMMPYPGGGLRLARTIERGLGDNETMRKFISRTFEDNPSFLYGDVLSQSTVSDTQMLDYISFGFESWARYRKIPANEESAIYQVLKPTLFRKLRLLLGK